MNEYLSQFVLSGSNHNSESLVDILIVVFFVVAWIIRNLFLGQKQQSQQQKRQVSHKPAQGSPVSSPKNQVQKDRVEQFLESILQNKKIQQQHPSRPVVQKSPSIAVSGIQNASVVPYPKQVLKSKPVIAGNTPSTTESHLHTSAADEALGVSIMELPTIDSKLENIPELKEPAIQENQKHLIYHPEKTSYKKMSGLLPTFFDSDDLKRAVLYSEILGKPVSMRESQSIY